MNSQKKKNLKQLQQKKKQFHVAFICWHWSRAYVGLTLFIRVMCIYTRKRKIPWNQAIKNSKGCQLCVAPFSFSAEHLTFLLA